MIEILILLAAVILAFEIALNSSLADEIKTVLKLNNQSQKRLKALSKLSFWNTLWGLKLMYLLFPLTLILSIIFTIYLKVNELFNCPYCLGYQLSWIGLVLIAKISIPTALLLALFSIAIGKIYNYIN